MLVWWLAGPIPLSVDVCLNVMRPACFALVAALALTGCGSIGNTMPPALHIPRRVIDLSAVQRGDKIEVRFTLPTRSTENMLILKPIEAELAIGPAMIPLKLEVWSAGTRRFKDIPTDAPIATYAAPATEWIGKDVVVAVQLLGDHEHTAGWSNLVTLSVVPPLATPSGLALEPVSEGVRLTWQGNAPKYRVYRRLENNPDAVAVGETERTTYTDATIEYLKTYHYSVEAFRVGGDIHAFSARTPEQEIRPVDTWPPPVPTGLAAIPSPGRVELAWDRSTAPDWAGYNIFRGEGDGPLKKIGEARGGPSYSDTTTVAGKTYRYAVSAFDQIPNESEKSAPVTVLAQ